MKTLKEDEEHYLCINCKHYRELTGMVGQVHGVRQCKRPMGINPVDGSMVFCGNLCHEERQGFEDKGRCGLRGKYYDPID